MLLAGAGHIHPHRLFTVLIQYGDKEILKLPES